MKKKDFTILKSLPGLMQISLALAFVLSFAIANAQAPVIVSGSTTNNAAVPNSSIPSTGTGGCTVAPQNTTDALGLTGTNFIANVPALPAGFGLASVSMNLTHTWDGDLAIYLENPAGTQRIELTSGNGGSADNYTNTVFSDNAAISITAGTAPFTGTFRPEGSTAATCGLAGTGLASTPNRLSDFTAVSGAWKLRVMDSVGGDAGTVLSWSLTFSLNCPISGVPLPALNFNTCAATIPVPATAAGCGFTYTVNGGAPITVPAGTTTVTPPNLINGTNTIVWNSGTHIANQTVNISDMVNPVVTCGPDQVYNLLPGECAATIHYNYTITDDCPPTLAPLTLPFQTPFVTGFGQAGVNFVLRNESGQPMTIRGLQTQLRVGTWTLQAYARPVSANSTWVGHLNDGVAGASNANWTFLGQQTITSTAILNLNNFDFTDIDIPAGQQVAMYVTSTVSIGGGPLITDLNLPSQGVTSALPPSYSNGQLRFCAGVLRTAIPGVFSGGVFGNPMPANVCASDEYALPHFNMQYTVGAPPLSPMFTGPQPGDVLHYTGSPYNVKISALDAAGNMGMCQFRIFVNEYANPTQTLACNDLVQISLDETCVAVLSADQILEGGPYGCYEDYDVFIYSPLGQNLGNTVNSSHIGQTLDVRVYDEVNPNNYCWGKIHVEDKLAPTITCPAPTAIVSCDPNVQFVTSPPAPITRSTTVFPTAVIEPGAANEEHIPVSISGLPSNTVVTDVNVYYRAQHTWVGDLVIDLTGPNGDVINLINQQCGTADNIDVTFDDNGGGAACAINPAITGVRAPAEPLATFNGINGNGTWTVDVFDLFAGDGGPIQEVRVEVTAQAQFVLGPTATDNCSTPSLTWIDNFTTGNCNGNVGVLNRFWTATDASGNTSSCTQTVNLLRPSVNDVTIPNDIKFTCEQYAYNNDITDAKALHPYVGDSDGTTNIIDVNLDPWCDDDDLSNQDDASKNNTNTANGGNGCPGFAFPNNGLDDEDVLVLTGSGVPTVRGGAITDACNFGITYVDDTIHVCAGTFKILREWKIVDWCASPVAVRKVTQVIKVADEEAPSIKFVQQDTFHQVYTIGGPGPLWSKDYKPGCPQYPNYPSINSTINVSYNRNDCPNHIYQIGDTTQVFFNTAGTQVTAWDVVEDVIYLYDPPTNPIPHAVKLKLRKFAYVTSRNIDVYSASIPPNSPPHAVCQGNVILPAATDMEDNCSGLAGFKTEIWTVNNYNNPTAPVILIATANTNGGVFSNIPMFQNGLPAKYFVRYYATDGCNNTAFADLLVTLRDRVPPVAICDEITELALPNNGVTTGTSCATLHPSDLDDGSYDNCKPIWFLAAKMDGTGAAQPNFAQGIYNRCYYPTLNYCCEEVGERTVILLVLDADPRLTNLWNAHKPFGVPAAGCDPTRDALYLLPPPQNPNQNHLFVNVPGVGAVPVNFNTCMVTLQVTDKLPPVVTHCPANTRITCDWYGDNLETYLNDASKTSAEKNAFLSSKGFGDPVFFDNCPVTIEHNVQLVVDNCYEGTIVRQWRARDAAGNVSGPSPWSCTQRIFVDHVSDWVVEFPADKNVQCVPGTDPVAEFGLPEIFFETCELIAVSHEDTYFDDVSDACYKIIRQWTVINWCVTGANVDQEVVEASERQFQIAYPNLPCDLDGDGDCDTRTFRDSWNLLTGNHPITNTTYKQKPQAIDAQGTGTQIIYNPDLDPDSDPWDGFITYEQIIKVEDQADPAFVDCTNPISTVEIKDNTCAATVIIPVPDVIECSRYELFVRIQFGNAWVNAGTLTVAPDGTVLSGSLTPFFNVAPGVYPVEYKAVDECNNWAVCNTTIRVEDKKKPTPYCEYGLVIELMNTDPAMVQVWANDFNVGSFDNCPGQLKFSFSSNTNDIGRTYTCDNLGSNDVQMWVTDAAGNQDYCETFVIIQANMGQCDDPLQVGGAIARGTDPMNGVEVNINNAGGSISQSTTTVNGQYLFADVPSANDYTITPTHDVLPLNGVTTFDLVMISKHILGVQLLDSPYKIIAADANKSNSVTTFDLVEIRKLILLINSEFPNNTSWRFVPKSFVFANPANPFTAAFPEVININNLDADKLNNDFVAIKVGDVNSNASTSLNGGNQDRNMVGDLVLNVDDKQILEGETYTVEFKATDFNVSGYQFTMSFDKNALEFVEVAPAVADASNFGLTMLNEGVITTSWNSDEAKQLVNGDVVFGLTFKAKQNGRLSDMLGINSRYTVAEAYNANAELLNVALSFNNTIVAGGFELYQNTPNPVASATTIGFYLPEATSATLTISDVQGKVVKVIPSTSYAKGYNQVTIKRSDLGATGVLYYRLDTGADSATRKMILVD